MFAGGGLEPDGGDAALVGVDAATVAAGCLPAHGARVPDSETLGGVPLLETGAAVLSLLPGSSIVLGPVAQGAAVPTKGLGFGGRLPGMLVVWLAHGAGVPD